MPMIRRRPGTVAFLVWSAVLAGAFVAVPAGPSAWSAVAAALPVALAAVAAAASVTSRRSSSAPSSALVSAQAGLAAAAATVGVGAAWAFVMAPAQATELAVALATVPAMAGVALLVGALAAALGWSAGPVDLRGGLRRALVAGLGGAMLGGFLVVPMQAASAAVIEPATAAPCVEGQQQRNYAVAATTVDLPFNRWGATLASGRIFVLEQDLAATKNWSRPLSASAATDPAKNRRLRPRPLVLRANEGDCVRVTLTNRLSTSAGHGLPSAPRVGIQASGVVLDARKAGGARVGFDADPTVAIGQAITYFWKVPAQEGLFLFQDMATPAGGEHDAGSRGVGLYGALAVEPKGSVWTDPRSGAVLSGTAGNPGSTYTAAATQSGELYVEADIHPPGKPSFRESVQLAQDEITGIGMGFNYGSEPMSNREAKACPDCLGEETWLSSWPYGDPALIKLASGPGPWLPKEGANRRESEDCGLPESCFVSNVFHSYNGDATKIRFGLAGVKETHVFHLHAHQWLADERDDAVTGDGPGAKPESTTIDSQSFGPGEAYTANLLYGAGSKNGTFGDSIFHCHLYPHFAEGFWSLLRVHDVELDGSTATPDGVNVRPLIPLPGQAAPPAPTADNPGFPGMIPGTYGWRAPQPPDAITEGGADGTAVRPAPRLVAGSAIDEAKLAVEEAVMLRKNGGQAAKPGAPFANPCPTGAREVDYDVTVLQRDLVYNEAGDHDPQARVMVLTKDVPGILSGATKVEPLFIRVNAGDCINFSLTNMAPNWTGGDAFQQLTQTNMAGGHVHLVKFDVTASDGGSNGWNYQQAAFTQEQAELTRKQAAGEVTCTAGAPFYGGESTGCRIADRTSWTAPADSSGMWGQTIHERWYADYELRTAFTHDHHFAALVQNHGHYGALIVEPAGFDVRSPATGEYLQPINNAAHGAVCGPRCSGGAVGESVDLVGPGANDDYREYGIAIADFVPLVRKGGDPKNSRDVINPPGAPEHFPDADPGTFAINYRNAPLTERSTFNGAPVDPAHRFSSYVFGDPMTPLLQGYARDNVKLRVIQGSQEEQHLFQVNGLRWREEPDDPQSPLVNAQTIGISEAFNAEMPGFDCGATDTPCRGDYLYGGTNMDDLWTGMWGIMRVHGAPTPGLRALPDNAPTGTATAVPAPRSRIAPPRASGPGRTCPTTAPVTTFDVVAMTTKLVYNQYGDNDPEGLLYVLAEDEAAVSSGAKKPEPLVIRANAGDCVKVNLRNALPTSYGNLVNGVDGDPALIGEPIRGTKMGTRVSMHPQLVRHDVRLSDGSAIGFNPDSTAGIGQTVSYEWFADTELGASNIVDFGDVRGHRQHGLAGALVVEPKDATYHDPATGIAVRSGVSADIRVPGQEDFRETTLIYQDGMDLRTTAGGQVPDKKLADFGPDGEPIVEIEPDGGEFHAGGHDDAGEKGVNYTNAPLHRRLGAGPGAFANATSAAWASVFSSAAHGDPMTPIARAYAGDQIRMRVLGANRPRQMGFQVDGASWRQEPYDTESALVGVQGGFGTGKAVNAHLRLPAAGDHLWSSPTTYGLPDGIWGMARVYPKPADAAGFTPTPRATPDSPFSTSRPLQPLERTSLGIRVFADADADGVLDAGETVTAGAQVRLLTTAGTQVLTTTTGADGRAAFSPARGSYDVQVVAPAGSTVVGGATRRVNLTGDSARTEVAFGLASGSGVRALVFEDLDADGVRDAGEVGAAGFTVTLDGATVVAPVVTGTDGSAAFSSGVAAGTWSAGLQARGGWRTTTAVPVSVTVGSGIAEVAIGVARLTGFAVRPVDDVDADGVLDAGEAPIAGLVVEVAPTGGTPARVRTDADGAVVDPAGKASTVRVLQPDSGLPWLCATAQVTTAAGQTSVACAADGTIAVPGDATEVTVLGTFTDGVATTTLYDDADRDGRRDAGEAPLADWPVALVTATDKVEVARITTDETGTAGFTVPAGRYEIVPAAPTAAVAWTATAASSVVDVVRGRTVAASQGWVQPGSISVGVFRDNDSDGVRELGEDPLVDRQVNLLNASNAIVATQHTDGTGRVAFPATAGQAYKVALVTGSGWTITSPRTGTSVVKPAPVTAPADGGQGTVEIGAYNTLDRVAPPAPVATPGGGALTAATLVSISGESGAQIRYTLDGTAPSATRGMLYTNTAPVRISMDRVLRAVAIDGAGNVSADLAASFDLPWTGVQGVVAPSAWAVTSGGAPRGGAAETTSDDGRVLAVGSVPVAAKPTVDVTGTIAVPAQLRAAAALNLSVSLRTTLRSSAVKVQYWDVSTSTWRVALQPTAGLDESKLDVDLGTAAKLVAADGTVKVRLTATNGQPFDLAVDQTALTLVNRR